jgi:hypothetical protein
VVQQAISLPACSASSVTTPDNEAD